MAVTDAAAVPLSAPMAALPIKEPLVPKPAWPTVMLPTPAAVAPATLTSPRPLPRLTLICPLVVVTSDSLRVTW